MEISAKSVKNLRDQTGAGMMKCKDALVACNGNFEEAVDYLRKKGLASADKKSGRATCQGVILPFLSADGKKAVLCEVNCETDFVAQNEKFKFFVDAVGQAILTNPSATSAEQIETLKLADGQTVGEARKTLIATIGENISIGRCEHFQIPAEGLFDTYVHNDGLLTVLVQVSCSNAAMAGDEELRRIAHEIALQITVSKPDYVSRAEVPADVIARERAVIKGQIENSEKERNKPESILAKIIDGRLDKYFKEICLIEQDNVKDDTQVIGDLLQEYSKKHNGTASIKLFRRWAVGESAATDSSAPCPAPEGDCCSSCCCS